MKMRRSTLRGCYLDNDFKVFLRSRPIGRIAFSAGFSAWEWKIAGDASRLPIGGLASSLEEARRAFAQTWLHLHSQGSGKHRAESGALQAIASRRP
jgi:hypothetical protein